MTDTIRIATRKSALALWQAEHVQAKLQALLPQAEVTLVPMSTRGDEILDRSLAQIGGKGLFLKELEEAMLDGRADCAVHSAKDMPFALDERFAIAAFLPREDPSDALCCRQDWHEHGMTFSTLPEGSCIGTSSLRRAAQIRHKRPDLDVQPVRGNVQKRLQRLADGDFDALVLATSGLKRLQLDHHISQKLHAPEWVYAVGQGALAIETLSTDQALLNVFAQLACTTTTRCVTAERVFNAQLEGSCQTPIGAHAIEHNGVIHLQAFVASEDGQHMLTAQSNGNDPQQVGDKAAEHILAQGGKALLGTEH